MGEGFSAAGHFLLVACGSAVLGAVVALLCGKRVVLQVIANFVLSFALTAFGEWLIGNLDRWPTDFFGYYGYYLTELVFPFFFFVLAPMVLSGLVVFYRWQRTA